jgi:Pyruvate/2-oxoacid:ferredoxin oxidoreductase gamma subunit
VFEIRIHGRGGQGVVTAAELLSVAAFNEAPRSARSGFCVSLVSVT